MIDTTPKPEPATKSDSTFEALEWWKQDRLKKLRYEAAKQACLEYDRMFTVRAKNEAECIVDLFRLYNHF